MCSPRRVVSYKKRKNHLKPVVLPKKDVIFVLLLDKIITSVFYNVIKSNFTNGFVSTFLTKFLTYTWNSGQKIYRLTQRNVVSLWAIASVFNKKTFFLISIHGFFRTHPCTRNFRNTTRTVLEMYDFHWHADHLKLGVFYGARSFPPGSFPTGLFPPGLFPPDFSTRFFPRRSFPP